MIKFRSLQQRTFLYIIFPTFLVLLGLSSAGFLMLRSVLIEQWSEVAVARLQQKAYELDVDLRKPKQLFSLLQQNEDSQVNIRFFQRIIANIEELETVIAAKVTWPGSPKGDDAENVRKNVGDSRSSQHTGDRFVVHSPRYSKDLINRTISLLADLENSRTHSTGQVEIIFSFDVLIEQLLELKWWKIHKAYLVDEEGNVLATAGEKFDLEDYFPMRAFGTMSALEKDTMLALQTNQSGTVFGPGHPPEQVSGYYHLEEAPWSIVVIADGEKILQPIVRFRLIYFLSLAITIVLILLFIRGSVSTVISRIQRVSAAAEKLAKGTFSQPLVDNSRDEVGELTMSFNKMTQQLQQRLEMKEAINLARDVQQSLLPQNSFAVEGITVEGISIYCDETGGDYYDILNLSEDGSRVAVVVADVVGHGISAALLMSSVRALLRCRFELPGTLSEIIRDVNRLLCKDTEISGSFVTLFCLHMDLNRGAVHWVRAGHEPAFIYSEQENNVSSLVGRGLALGVEPEWVYDSYELILTEDVLTILLGSDGAWEVTNSRGDQFGKKRIEDTLKKYNSLPGEKLLKRITDEIGIFRGDAKQDDDITLVVVKLDGKVIKHGKFYLV